VIARSVDLLDEPSWRTGQIVSPVLAGVALAAGALSALWATRPRHTLALAGWIMLGSASVVGHWLLPSMLGGSAAPMVEARAMEKLERMAYGLEGMRDTPLEPISQPMPPAVPSLWHPEVVARALPSDSTRLLSIDPALLTRQGTRRPVWLVVRSNPAGRVVLSAIADNRVSRSGEPLFHRLSDTLSQVSPTSLLELPPDLLRPDAPNYRLRQGDVPGVPAESWVRRVVLAWALQAGELLGSVPPGSRIDWHLSPQDRLVRLAPFADWSAPTARVINGQLIWLLDGYLASGTFPLTGRVMWRDRRVGSVRAAFLGTVNAETGAARVFLQPGADAMAETWAALSHGVVEAGSAIPEAVLRAAPYPAELFRIQAQELEHTPWNAGSLERGAGRAAADPPAPQVGWAPDTSGPQLVSTFEAPGERRLSAVLIGSRDDGRTHLQLIRLDSTATLPIKVVLGSRWANFPSYDALNDSIEEGGGELEAGPVRVDIGPGGPVAYQAHYASRSPGRMALVWVSVAARDRLGAGRTLQEAWSNLLGTTVPAPPGTAQSGRLEEARRWLELADSALKIGDWSEFGRAWSTLRGVLGLPLDSTRF